MKVKELIEALSQLDPELEVVLTDYNFSNSTAPLSTLHCGVFDAKKGSFVWNADVKPNAVELN